VRFIGLLAVSCLGLLSVLSGCGGSSSVPSANPTQPPSTQPATNPTPNIASIDPSSLVAGSAAQIMTVNGSGFIASTTVNLNGTALATTWVSSTSVTAMVAASAIAADGTAHITASNPAPGGRTSAIENYSVTLPTPGITGLSPQSVLQGAVQAAAIVSLCSQNPGSGLSNSINITVQ
jgi:hypothetical protein